MKINFYTFPFFAFALYCLPSFAQQNGALDSTFNSDGIYINDFGNLDVVNDVKIQADQKIVLTGVTYKPNYKAELKVLRLLPDGNLDSAFAVNGVFAYTVTNETYGIESQIRSDGKIVVMGLAAVIYGYNDMLLLRLNTNGTLDTTFGTNGYTVADFTVQNDLSQACALQKNGKIVVSGTIIDMNSFFNVPSLVRFTEDGIIDSTFGTNGVAQYPAIGGDNELTSVIIQDDNKIVAAGHYSSASLGVFDIFLMRLDTNGIFDNTFGANGVVITSINSSIDDCFGLSQDKNGDLVACGFTTLSGSSGYDMVVLKYTSSGALDPNFGTGGIASFNNGGEDVAYDIDIQTDNKIIVGGTSGLPFTGPRPAAVWRYLPNGNLDSTFGLNGFVSTYINAAGFQDFNSVAIQADDKIVAAGKSHNGSNHDFVALRYDNDLSTRIENKIINSNLQIAPNPSVSGGLVTILFNQNENNPYQIQLFDVTGKQLFTIENKKVENSKIQLKLPATIGRGLYFISVKGIDSNHLLKLMVE